MSGEGVIHQKTPTDHDDTSVKKRCIFCTKRFQQEMSGEGVIHPKTPTDHYDTSIKKKCVYDIAMSVSI